MTTANSKITQPEPDSTPTERQSPFFQQAVAVTRAYADHLRRVAAENAPLCDPKNHALLALARRVVRVMGCDCNADDRSAGHLCLRCEAREAIELATDGGR